MTITSKVYEIIFEALGQNPDGLRWSELLNIIKEKNPSIHAKTANGLIWRITDRYPEKIYKPEKGRFRLTKYKSN